MKFGKKEVDFVHPPGYKSSVLWEFKPLQSLLTDTYGSDGLVGSGYAVLEKITVLSVSIFGKDKATGDPIVGLMTANLGLFTASARGFIPGVVFLRADAVAVILTEVVDGEEWALLVNQPRAPCGKWMLECVAGMLQKMEGDEDDNFTVVGKAVDELKEEAGLDLAAGKLVKLGTYWPSTGGTRETITYFHCEYPGMVNLVQNAKNNTFGLGAEGEVTKRVVMKVADALKATEDGDAKFQMGYAKLQQMRAAQGS